MNNPNNISGISASDIAAITATVAGTLEERIMRNFRVIPTLTLTEAAEAVGISDEKMRQLCNAGEIPYIRMDRLYRIKPADINEYLENHYHKKG